MDEQVHAEEEDAQIRRPWKRERVAYQQDEVGEGEGEEVREQDAMGVDAVIRAEQRKMSGGDSHV